MITEKDLLDNGFEEFSPSPLLKAKNIKKCYQKTIRDNNDRRLYFIDALGIDFGTNKARPDLSGIQYELSGQYYFKGTHDAVNMTFIGMEIKEVEERLNEMLKKDIIEPYDLDE